MSIGTGRFGVSPAGTRVFFEADVGQKCEGNELFVRVNDSKTLEVSKPEGKLDCGAGVAGVSEACSGANRGDARFEGANWDGSVVYFTTASPLVSSDTNSSRDLYMARIGEEAGEPKVSELVQVSHDPREGSEAGEAQKVVAMSTDGSRVYYFANGVLAGENAEHESPASGAENLYLYDANSGVTTFVTDFCSGPGVSGSVPDPRCPAGLDNRVGRPFQVSPGERHYPINDSEMWSTGETEAQVNECADPASTGCDPGRFLVFTSYAQLTPDDRSGARQVFRYDARTGRIVRVSVGENGHNHNGNQPFNIKELYGEGAKTQTQLFEGGEFIANAKIGEFTLSDRFGNTTLGGSAPAEIEYEMLSRDISEDGSRIVFKTDEQLSAAAVNGRPDIYEWHEDQPGKGTVGLVSSGTAESQDGYATLSPSGRDLFFATTAGLARADTENDTDIYDARIGGGFVESEPTERCAGDACQGALSNPEPLLIPGSVSQTAGENYPAPIVTVAKPKTKNKPKHKPKHKRKGKARGKGKRASVGRKARKARGASRKGRRS